MLPTWASQTVTVVRPGIKESRGSEIRDWTNATTHDISGCSVQPASTELSMDGRVTGIFDGMTAYLPPNADIAEGDRVIYDGLTYEINGTPRKWQSATGLASYVQVGLRRWDG